MSLAVVGLLVAATPSVATPSSAGSEIDEPVQFDGPGLVVPADEAPPAPLTSDDAEPQDATDEATPTADEEPISEADATAEDEPVERPEFEVDDPLLSYQWNLDEIRAPSAWSYTLGSPQVTLAVIDTGVDPNHQDFDGAFWQHPTTGAAGYDHVNAVTRTYVSAEEDWHGTAVAGLAVARANDGYGMAGVAPNVSLMVHRIYASSSATEPPNDASYERASAAVRAAAASGADVILLTWGGTQPNNELFQAIRDAGVPVVAAAGNDGQDLSANDAALRRYPAMYRLPNLVTVAASDRDDGLLVNYRVASNYGGRHVDIAAPGQEVVSVAAEAWHNYFEGTSFAAPQVAGALALGRSLSPGTPTNELVAALISSARPVSTLAGQVTSGGVLDVEAFLVALERPVCGDQSTQAPFGDVAPDAIHAASIACIAAYNITRGTADGSFAPRRAITRGEMATFLVRVLDAAEYPIPDDVPTAFTDTAGSIHARSIDVLADAGVVRGFGDGRFAPQREVTRGQMATFLVTTVRLLEEPPEFPERAWFDDIDTSVHRGSILAARELGITLGTSEPRRFAPGNTLTREQMASFLARSLDALGRLGVTIDPVA